MILKDNISAILPSYCILCMIHFILLIQVRVAVHYCGINFADLLMSMGLYQEKPPLPAVFGNFC